MRSPRKVIVKAVELLDQVTRATSARLAFPEFLTRLFLVVDT